MLKILLCVLMILTTFHCGYKLAGTSSIIPAELKTIFIPDFGNKTTKFQASEFISNAIRDEFIQRTKLKLVNSITKADSKIEGKITGFKLSPVSYASDGNANLYEVLIVINLSFINLKTGEIIYKVSKLQFTDSYNLESGDSVGFENEALRKIAKRFASQTLIAIFTGID